MDMLMASRIGYYKTADLLLNWRKNKILLIVDMISIILVGSLLFGKVYHRDVLCQYPLFIDHLSCLVLDLL